MLHNYFIVAILAIIIVSLVFFGIMKKIVKDEIIENNDFINRFRDIAKDDPYILHVLEESSCDEKSLLLEFPKQYKESKKYLKKVNEAKNEFVHLLDMPCIGFMNTDEIIGVYTWCKDHGKRDCSICYKKDKPQGNQLLWNPQENLDPGTGNLFDNPYF